MSTYVVHAKDREHYQAYVEQLRRLSMLKGGEGEFMGCMRAALRTYINTQIAEDPKRYAEMVEWENEVRLEFPEKLINGLTEEEYTKRESQHEAAVKAWGMVTPDSGSPRARDIASRAKELSHGLD